MTLTENLSYSSKRLLKLNKCQITIQKNINSVLNYIFTCSNEISPQSPKSGSMYRYKPPQNMCVQSVSDTNQSPQSHAIVHLAGWLACLLNVLPIHMCRADTLYISLDSRAP